MAPKPAVMAGGAFVLILLVVVVWGMLTKPKFWGLFSKEFDECEPEEDNKIANADKHQLDKDKKCVLVKTCASGYSPNSSNTACMSTAPPPPPPPPAAAVTTPPPPAVTTPIVSETRDADLTSYVPVDPWNDYALANKVEYAMQYAKIGDKWQVNKCIGGYIPFANVDDETRSSRPKVCKAIGATCGDGTKPDNTQTLGYTATGKCGSVECKSGYTLYDGNCVPGTDTPGNNVPDKWVKPGNKYFVESMGWRPSYVEIPADELQLDRSCRDMCANIGVSKTGKAFRSLLPAEWKGSVVSKTAPTNRFFNYSIDEIATNPKLWDETILDTFHEFLKEKNEVNVLGWHTPSGNNDYTPLALGYGSGYDEGVPEAFKNNELDEKLYKTEPLVPGDLDSRVDVTRNKALKAIFVSIEHMTDAKKTEWKTYLKNAAKCGCEATEDPRYLFN